MKRDLLDQLIRWKSSNKRKPLIIQGARQVGKTWLMKEFGKLAFEQVVYLNFESSERLRNLFIPDFNISRIITVIEIETGQKINPKNTLLIFDEIQEVEKGLTALKYFYEMAPEYHILAAGSLLGVSLQKNTSFPVGKVDILHLYPLSFIEFLNNLGEEPLSSQVISKNWEVVNTFHDKLVNLLRTYYYTGGMPEVVSSYIENGDLEKVLEIQQKILIGYENDFAKHAPNQIVPKIRLVWQSLLGQLAKENKKFIYGQIKKGARAKDFEVAIQWLVDAGLILRINCLNNAIIPLNAYIELDVFKLYLMDIGLLNAIANLDVKILLDKNKILNEFKGALTEQFVCQQLIIKHQLFYWTNNQGTAEVDFVLQFQNQVIPIEVKAEENLKAKSLKVFVSKFSNAQAIRTSMAPFRKEDWLTNVPLYAIGGYFE